MDDKKESDLAEEIKKVQWENGIVSKAEAERFVRRFVQVLKKTSGAFKKKESAE